MTSKIKKGAAAFFKSYGLTYGIIGFMLGRLELFGIINPVIIGYISVFCGRPCFCTAAFSGILGLISIRNRIFISRYIGAILILCALHILGGKRKGLTFGGGLAMLCSGITFAIFYDFSMYYVILGIIEAVLAVCLNIMLRDNIGVLNIMDNPVVDTGSYTEEMERIASDRLRNIAELFRRISRSYIEATASLEINETEEKQNILDIVTAQSCSRCSMLEECWHKSCERTYKVFYNAIDSWIKTGEVQELPKSFRDTCGFSDVITARAKGCLELYISKRLWRERLSSVRRLVAEQMKSAGDAIDELYRDMAQSKVDTALSNRIYKGLTSSLVKSAAAVKRDGVTEIYIRLKSCHNCNVCTDVILPEIKEITGRDFIKWDKDCVIEKDNCFLHLIEEPPIRLSVASASASKEDSDISGDCYTYMNIKGKCIIAVADGMGSGSKAREESAASIELYEDFVCAGFGSETTLDIINSVLLMGEDRESFTTLDICTVDLYSGKTEFIKIGAVSTVVVHPDGVDIIRSSTLPAGILGQVDTDAETRQLEKGDIIVMMTDGVLDSMGNVVRNESWLIDVIEKRRTNNPKILAQSILDKAVENSQGTVRDDMTVLVSSLY